MSSNVSSIECTFDSEQGTVHSHVPPAKTLCISLSNICAIHIHVYIQTRGLSRWLRGKQICTHTRMHEYIHMYIFIYVRIDVLQPRYRRSHSRICMPSMYVCIYTYICTKSDQLHTHPCIHHTYINMLQCLVATNVAARGLDIPEVDLVIMCHPPDSVETYIHRSGIHVCTYTCT